MVLEIKEGSLPQWDEWHKYGFRPDGEGFQTNNTFAQHRISPFSPSITIARQKCLGSVGSIDDHMLLLEEVLKDNQGYHLVDEQGNPWCVSFPFAIYLKKGDPIKNLSTGEVYTVSAVLHENDRTVMLSGNLAPKATDRLRLDDLNTITFTHGFPRSFVNSHKIDTDSEIADQISTFNEGIHWLLNQARPATDRNEKPFSSRGLRPRPREMSTNPANNEEIFDIHSLAFDNIVCFDCWATHNHRASMLVNWFEDVMFRSTWILRLFSGAKIYYWQRDEDEEVYRFRNDLTKRTVKYHYRTERIYHRTVNRLKEADLRVTYSDGTDISQVQTGDMLVRPDQINEGSSIINESL